MIYLLIIHMIQDSIAPYTETEKLCIGLFKLWKLDFILQMIRIRNFRQRLNTRLNQDENT